MLFRYKVKPNTSPGFSNPSPYNHYVKIQMYKNNSHILHWKTIAETTLCDMAYELDTRTYNDFRDIIFPTSLSTTELYSALTRYGDMSNFVKAYIIDILGESWKKRNQKDEREDQIFKFVVTDGWNAIEIKEGKTNG